MGIGGWEVLLILIIALVIWGPEQLVKIARTLGRMMYTIKKATSDVTTQVRRELEEQEKEHPPQQREGNKGR